MQKIKEYFKDCFARVETSMAHLGLETIILKQFALFHAEDTDTSRSFVAAVVEQ